MEEDDVRIEEELELELSKICISPTEADDTNTDLSADASSDSEPISDELPESVLHYLHFVRSRSQNAERLLLQDFENDELSSDIYKVVPNSSADCLVELAFEYNEDPEEFKKRVLSEIEEEELQMSATPHNDIEPSNNEEISSSEVAPGYSLTDDGDTVLSFTFQEVEERCRQEYELWLQKQKELEHEKIQRLKADRDMRELQNEKEEKMRQQRQEELKAERMKLEMFNEQQQTMMEEEQLKEEDAWREQLRQHQELINTLHTQIAEEKKALEEQKETERQRLMEQQELAALKIQATFRAFVVYKNYAPVLREWREQLKRKREVQRMIETEQKEKEERLKMKRQKDEEERKRKDEIERQEFVEKMKRREEYEKKEIMRQEKQRILEEMKKKDQLKFVEERKMEPEIMNEKIKMAKKEQEKVKGDDETGQVQRKMDSGKTSKDTETEERGKEVGKEKEQEEDKIAPMQSRMSSEDFKTAKKGEGTPNIKEQTTEKAKVFLEKELQKQGHEMAHHSEKHAEKHGLICDNIEYDNVLNKDRELESGNEEDLNKLNNETSADHYAEDHSLAIVELQENNNTSPPNIDTAVLSIITAVTQESSTHSDHVRNHANVQLCSGEESEEKYVSAATGIEIALKAINDEVTDHWDNGEMSMKCSEQPLTFSDSIEQKRLLWMKTCKSWSRIYRENQRKKVAERSRPWKRSDDMMPPLSAAMIIQAGPWRTLQQVTTVTFQDLPGCNLSTLSQCPKLQFLSLRRCGLIALEGLTNCKDLKYIDVEENCIQAINCENLENLSILILNKNNISSLHGLYGCSNLWNLELSYNKITRIGGLESLKNLQRLLLNNNHLISTKGLSDAPTLVYIDCSFNHLTDVEGIQKCGLLQILKLQGNNLSEPPSLENHVLLRELNLEDNSISTLETLSTCWMPLLQTLSLSQNSLTALVPLFSYVSLEKLDISNNCLLDLPSVIQWLDGCHKLRELSLYGNPLLQSENWRCSVCKILPSLKKLNDENVTSDTETPEERIVKKPEPQCFVAFCQAQIQEIDLVSKKALTGLTGEFSVDAIQRQCWYFKKLMKLTSEHRSAHEYGILSTTKGEEAENQTNLNQEAITIIEKNNFFISGAKENKQNTPERWITSGHAQPVSVNSFTTVPTVAINQESSKQKKSIEYSLNHSEGNEDSNEIICLKTNKISKQSMASNGENCLQHFDSSHNLAAAIIQSAWRAYKVRKAIHFCTKLHVAAMVIQSFWRQYCIRKRTADCKELGGPSVGKNKAATTIQALWKGFHLRKKLASALAAVRTAEVEDSYTEVNVDDFTFDEAVIQKEWPTLDSTHFLSQTLIFSNQPPLPKELARCEDKMHHSKWLPHKSWQFRGKPISFLSGNGQMSNRSEKSTHSQLFGLKPPQKSLLRCEKEEKISEEWGFKDISTAQLMLKRAYKMKAKKYSSKKFDPAVRLALFKNNENKHPLVKPPKKPQTANAGYFEGQEAEFPNSDILAEKMERNKQRTYQWLHSQVWDYEGATPRDEKCKHFLPEIDPDILKSGRVQFVTSPVRREDTDLELVSMTSGSTLSQNREKNNQPHRHSAGSSKKDAPAPERSHLGPSHKERISFRDNPVQRSGGWGSGKRKAKPLK